MKYDVAVIGGGPAGMMAAIQAAKTQRVVLLEKNESLGKKLLITGKGRCNLTNSCDIRDIVEAFGKEGKFLYGALSRFSNKDIIQFFEDNGLETKIERGNRVFPCSDRSNDVLETLTEALKTAKVDILYGFTTKGARISKSVFEIESTDRKTVEADKLIIATGGKTLQVTGSTGDGYEFAKSFGHTLNKLYPALVPMFVNDEDVNSLAGLSLKNVELKFYSNEENKPFIKKFGQMLFTHVGISGPIVLDMSNYVAKMLEESKQIIASIDLKPALSEKKLLNRINREIKKSPKLEYKSLLKLLLPKSIIEIIMTRSQIDERFRIIDLTRRQKMRLVKILKEFRFNIDSVAPIEKGIVTDGGVELDEINSRTMESKIVPGLYFAGEILDLNGPTGGYNLQCAWSTGWLAGTSSTQ